MSLPDLRYIDPMELRTPPSRRHAVADKLQRQIAKYGDSMVGMPPIWAYEYPDGSLLIVDGVTRATRIAKQAPGKLVPVEVIGQLRRPRLVNPKLRELLS